MEIISKIPINPIYDEKLEKTDLAWILWFNELVRKVNILIEENAILKEKLKGL